MKNIGIDIKSLNPDYINLEDLKKLPFNISVFNNIEKDVKHVFNELINQLDKNESDILLIQYKLYIFYANIIYFKWFEKSCAQQNINLTINYENNPFLKELNSCSFSEKKIIPKSNFKLLKSRIKIIYSMIRNNKLKNILSPRLLVHNSFSIKKISKDFPHNFIIPFSYDFTIKKTFNENTDYENSISLVLWEKLNFIFEKYNFFLNEKEKASILLYTKRKLNYAQNTQKIVTKKFNKYPSNYLILDTPRNEINKSFSLCFINQNKQVHTFLHGHQHILDWDYYNWAEFPFSTHFTIYSDSLNQLEYLQKKYEVLQNRLPIIIEKVLTSNKFVIKQNVKNKKLLLISAAFTNFGGLSSAASIPELHQLTVELSIINYFKNLGFTVEYKSHPEGKYKGKLDNYIPIKNITEKFENILSEYEGFIFYYTRTSTFPAAEKTDKSIYLVDIGMDHYTPTTLVQLNNRCQIIPYEKIIQ